MGYKPNLFPKREGNTSRSAHRTLPEGTVELEHGRAGFAGPVSHLYKTHAPTRWSRVEGPLQHHSYDFNKLVPEDMNDPTGMATEILYNNQCRISISRRKEEMPYYFRNADGDEIIFVHRGEGIFECDYGNLTFANGDYIVIPRGTAYRLVPETTDNFFLIIESTDGHFDLPDRGMLGPNAQFDAALIETPKLPSEAVRAEAEWEIRVKKYHQITKVWFPFNPVQDTLGWKGSLTAWKINIDDFQPVVSPSYHLPPSVHTTFVAKGFVICSFVPRPLESPDVLRIPFYHSNIDYEELIFYHDGEFFSRHGIDVGNMTYHPPGIYHGPQPQAFDKVQNNPEITHTNEKAVMIDTRQPLNVTEAAKSVENPDYMKSWSEDGDNITSIG